MSLFSCPSCGLPAEDVRHFVVDSTDGPIEYYHACCIQMHRFTIPASSVKERLAAEATVPDPEPEVLDIQGLVPDGLDTEGLVPASADTSAEPAPAAVCAAATEPDEITAGLTHLPPPPTTVDALWAPRTRLAAGAFFAGGLSSGFLLSVPVVIAFAVVLGLMAVAVVASLVPMFIVSRRAGRGHVAPLDRQRHGAQGRSADEGRRAA